MRLGLYHTPFRRPRWLEINLRPGQVIRAGGGEGATVTVSGRPGDCSRDPRPLPSPFASCILIDWLRAPPEGAPNAFVALGGRLARLCRAPALRATTTFHLPQRPLEAWGGATFRPQRSLEAWGGATLRSHLFSLEPKGLYRFCL